MTTRILDLDGEGWVEEPDAIEALLMALEAPDWHGRSMNALIDSIAVGGINGIEPPYEIRIHGAGSMPEDARSLVADLARHVEEGIESCSSRSGDRRKVRFVLLKEPRTV